MGPSPRSSAFDTLSGESLRDRDDEPGSPLSDPVHKALWLQSLKQIHTWGFRAKSHQRLQHAGFKPL